MIRIISTIGIMLVLMFSFFGCFQKKKQPPRDLAEWLEVQAPGRYEVVSTKLRLTLKELYSSKRAAVVAEKADPDVQALVIWHKGTENLGVSLAELDSLFQSSREEVRKARAVHAALKTGGFEKISVGMDGDHAHIMAFAEPTPAARRQFLELVSGKLSSLPDRPASCTLYFMEEDVYGAEFQTIIPRGHWERQDSWQQKQTIVQLEMENPANSKDAYWRVNSSARRAERYQAEAYRQALAWAEKNIPQPFYLEPNRWLVQEPDDRAPLVIGYDFPLYDRKPADDETDVPVKGYVSGLYHTDEKTFTRIRRMQGE